MALGVGAAAGLAAWHAAGQAIHQVTGFLEDSVQASIDEAAGIQQLTTSLRANVAGWNGNTDAIEATIKTREALAFSDDELRSSLSRLSASTHDIPKAFDLQSTAMDLARFKGIDLASATEAIVKVSAGQYRSLKELGIQIDANATSEQALAAVHRVTAGQAEAFGNTTAGAMQAANIAVHDLQEDIGQKLAPAVKNAAVTIRKDLIPALEAALPILDHLGDAINILTLGGTKTNELSAADKVLYENEKALLEAHVDLTSNTAKMNVVMGVARTAVDILTGTFLHGGSAADTFGSGIRRASEIVKATSISIAGESNRGADMAAAAYLNNFGYIKTGAEDMSHELLSTFNRMPSAIGPAAKAAAELLPTAIEDARAATASEGASQAADYIAAIKGARSDFANAWGDFIDIQKHAHTTQAQMAILGGALQSKSLAKGMNDARPDVREAARAVVLDALNVLIAAGGAAGLAGTRAGQMFAASFGAGAGATGAVDTTVVSAAQILGSLNFALKSTGTVAKDSGGDIKNLTNDINNLAGAFDNSTGKSGGATKATKGLTDAQKAAAATLKADISDAYTKAKAAANSYADTEHDNARRIIDDSHRTRQAQIDDAHKSATARIDAEKRAVNEILDERRALLGAPVDAEEAQLRNDQNSRQRQHLVEAQQAANTGTTSTDANGNTVVTVDQNAVRDANDALEEFDRQLAIDADRLAADNAAKAIDANTPVSQTDVNNRIGSDQAGDLANVPGAGMVSLNSLGTDQTNEDANYKLRSADEDKRYATEKADADARWTEQKKKIDDQIAAASKATKSTDTLADVNTKLAGILAAAFGVSYNPKTGKVTGGGNDSSNAKVTLGFDRSTGPDDGQLAAGSGEPTVIVQVHIDGSTTFDSNGVFAKQLGEVLAVPIVRAFRTNGMKTGKGGSVTPDHDHPLSS